MELIGGYRASRGFFNRKPSQANDSAPQEDS